MYKPQMNNGNQTGNSSVNVGTNERIIALVIGAVLITVGIVRGGLRIPALLSGAGLLYHGATGNNPLYRALGVNTAIGTPSNQISVPHRQGIHATKTVTIDRSAEDLYNFWHLPANLPQIMRYLDEVTVTGASTAHWKLKLPGGIKVEVDVETVNDVPYEVISWRSIPGSQLENAGSVRFRTAADGRGTDMTLTVEFVPPGGPLAQAVISLFGDLPNEYIGEFATDFKRFMETGARPMMGEESFGQEEELGG